MCSGSQLRMAALPDLSCVVRSAIGLTYVILLRLSGCVAPEGLRGFWLCRGVVLDDIHSVVLCKCFDGGVAELCAQAAVLDHLPWSCLDASLVSVHARWWRMCIREHKSALEQQCLCYRVDWHDSRPWLRLRIAGSWWRPALVEYGTE